MNPPGEVIKGHYSVREAAVWAGVSPKTMRRWMTQGLLYYQTDRGHKVLLRLEEIEAFLTRRQAPQVDLDAMVNQVLTELKVG